MRWPVISTHGAMRACIIIFQELDFASITIASRKLNPNHKNVFLGLETFSFLFSKCPCVLLLLSSFIFLYLAIFWRRPFDTNTFVEHEHLRHGDHHTRHLHQDCPTHCGDHHHWKLLSCEGRKKIFVHHS